MSQGSTEKSSQTGSSSSTAAPAKPKKNPQKKPTPRKLPPWHVVLLDDNDHSYEYVMEMLKRLFGHNDQLGFKLAAEVDHLGRAIVFTTHRELAELKRDQIHSFGIDQRVATCVGSMSAIIEPAEGE
jgi:ATP-dependent Clp protease adaptor protein ClpS